MDCQMQFFKYLFEKKADPFIELPVKDWLFFYYFWDISSDWESLQRTTTQLKWCTCKSYFGKQTFRCCALFYVL